MKNKKIAIIILIIAIVVVVGLCLTHRTITNSTHQNQTMNDTLTYINQKAGYTIDYPKDFQITYTNTERAFGSDVSFAFPESFTKGTNLSTDSVIKVEIIQGKTCSVQNFFAAEDPNSIKSFKIDNPGVFSQMASSTGAGAGNLYEKTVFAAGPNLGMCYGVELFIHSTNIGNYPEGTVKEFDRAKVNDVFNNMLNSFKISLSNI
jgi:hypothetical protein